jgi:hypothetical protein
MFTGDRGSAVAAMTATKPAVALTVFGVITACVSAVAATLAGHTVTRPPWHVERPRVRRRAGRRAGWAGRRPDMRHPEETGMGFGLEVELIEAAHRADLLTTPYVFSAADTPTKTAADLIVCYVALTTGGAIESLDDCLALVDEWSAAALEVREDGLVLCHGEPIAQPEDAAHVLRRARHCHGCYAASSMERLPPSVR